MQEQLRGLRRARRAVTAAVAVAAGLAILAAGCGGEDPGAGAPPGSVANRVIDDAGPPQRGGQLKIGLALESDNFSPVGAAWGASTYAVGLSIMEPLAAYDADRQIQPFLAKGFTHNQDFTEWTIALRDGVKLSDGGPVDAALVKTNLDAQRHALVASLPWAFVRSEDDAVSVTDDHTVVVRMNRPWSTFPHLLTSQAGIIASAATLTDAGKENPVGSGPFIFKSRERGRRTVVVRNPNYWRSGYPYLDEIEFKPIADVNARGKALDAGDINMMETGDPSQIIDEGQAARDGKVQMYTDDATNAPKWSIALNVSAPPFDDPVARRAVATAIDTAELSRSLYRGVLPPVRSAFGTKDPFHVDVPEYPTFDLEKARQLADDYRNRHGQALSFTAVLGPSGGGALGLTIQQQLRDAGIEMSTSTQTGPESAVAVAYGNFQATISVLFGSPHIDREFVFLASPADKSGLTLNISRVGVAPDGSSTGENDALVAAMTAARATDDVAEQKKQYEIVQHEMAKHLNLIFLVGQSSAVVADRETHGLVDAKLPDADGKDGRNLIHTGLILTTGLWRSSR